MKFELLPCSRHALVAVITFLHLGTTLEADILTDPTVQGAASFEADGHIHWVNHEQSLAGYRSSAAFDCLVIPAASTAAVLLTISTLMPQPTSNQGVISNGTTTQVGPAHQSSPLQTSNDHVCTLFQGNNEAAQASHLRISA